MRIFRLFPPLMFVMGILIGLSGASFASPQDEMTLRGRFRISGLFDGFLTTQPAQPGRNIFSLNEVSLTYSASFDGSTEIVVTPAIINQSGFQNFLLREAYVRIPGPDALWTAAIGRIRAPFGYLNGLQPEAMPFVGFPLSIRYLFDTTETSGFLETGAAITRKLPRILALDSDVSVAYMEGNRTSFTRQRTTPVGVARLRSQLSPSAHHLYEGGVSVATGENIYRSPSWIYGLYLREQEWRGDRIVWDTFIEGFLSVRHTPGGVVRSPLYAFSTSYRLTPFVELGLFGDHAEDIDSHAIDSRSGAFFTWRPDGHTRLRLQAGRRYTGNLSTDQEFFVAGQVSFFTQNPEPLLRRPAD